MEDRLKENINNIPFNPGVYLMKDKEDNIIYVGKAISLRKRVRQYFQKTRKSQRILNMVSLIDHIEYIVCSNEMEALILECNYIKNNKPKFNVLLKDDKTYPYVKVTIKDKYPSIYITRQKKEDGAKYYGPYADVKAIKDNINTIKEIFPVKRCKYNLEKKNLNTGNFPCLYYHIGRCLGPCINEVSRTEYQNMMQEICMFLDGKHSEIKKHIKDEIEKCIETLDFEKAQKYKERLIAIDKLNEKQKVSNLNETDADVIGYIHENNVLYLQIFKIRNGKIVDHDSYTEEDVDILDLQNTLYTLVSQYYLNKDKLPYKIYIKIEEEKDRENNLEYLEKILREKAERKVEIKVPKIGDKLKLIEMVENNIKINIEKTNTKQNIEENLSKFLKLNYTLNSIESYDISNLRNEYIVGAMVRWEDNRFNKSMYRKFKIKSTLTQNDPLCIYEVLCRRFNRKEEWPLPDVILLDGGKTQMNAALKAMKDTGVNVDIFGMVKDDNHKTNMIIDKDFNEYVFEDNKEHKNIYNFVARIQEEVHRFVITYHRSLRDKIK